MGTCRTEHGTDGCAFSCLNIRPQPVQNGCLHYTARPLPKQAVETETGLGEHCFKTISYFDLIFFHRPGSPRLIHGQEFHSSTLFPPSRLCPRAVTVKLCSFGFQEVPGSMYIYI